MHGKLMARLFALCCALFTVFTSTAPFVFGEVEKGDIGIGVNYPGVSVKYFTSDKLALELKGQAEKNIVIGGLRGYYYFSTGKKFLPFAGLEADFISFKGLDSKGTGFAAELFVGGEYFFGKKLSLQMDMGPAFVSLADKKTHISGRGLEYVVNFAINWYFGKKH